MSAIAVVLAGSLYFGGEAADEATQRAYESRVAQLAAQGYTIQGSPEANPDGRNPGVRVVIHGVEATVLTLVDAKIQGSAHPGRAWILRGAYAVYAGWKVAHNSAARVTVR